MGDIIKPLEASSEGLIESVRDSTSAEGMVFFHANEGKPLVTPWQVSRNVLFYSTNTNFQTAIFWTCMRSGIQVAAYSVITKNQF